MTPAVRQRSLFPFELLKRVSQAKPDPYEFRLNLTFGYDGTHVLCNPDDWTARSDSNWIYNTSDVYFYVNKIQSQYYMKSLITCYNQYSVWQKTVYRLIVQSKLISIIQLTTEFNPKRTYI